MSNFKTSELFLQSSQKAFEDHQEGLGASKDDDGLDFGLGMDLGGDLGGDNDLDLGMDIFSEGFNIDDDNPGGGDGDGDDKRNSMSQPNSPTQAQGGAGRGGQAGPGGPEGRGPDGQSFRYGQEEPGERIDLLNQPLAIGYLVSTAGTGQMPRWFWSACPHLERAGGPVFLRSALHINQASVLHGGDDGFGPAASSGKVHSLDSSYTTDVLR